jgi:hypothetical protein
VSAVFYGPSRHLVGHLDAHRLPLKTVEPRQLPDALITVTTREIALAGHPPAIMWVSFYANMNCPDVLCPPTYDLTGIPTKDYIQFIRNLKKEGIQYVLWQEKYWSQSAFDLLKLFNPKDLKIVSEDDHPDTGRLLLFKLL